MEIVQYLRSLGRLWRIVIVVPVVAALVAFAAGMANPRVHRGKATISDLVTAGPSSTAAQAVADFQALLFSEPVLTEVSDETGLSKSTLKHRLKLVRFGQSSVVAVQGTSPDRDDIEPMVMTAAREALALFNARSNAVARGLAEARRAVDAARKNVVAAEGQLSEFTARTGAVSPVEEFEAELRRVTDLERSLADARAGRGGSVSSFEISLAEARRDRDAAAAALAEYEPLNAAADRAGDDLTSAQRQFDDARAAAAGIQLPTEDAVSMGQVVRVSRREQLLRQTVVAFVSAFVLALLGAMIVDTFRRSRGVRGDDRGDAPPAAAVGFEDADTLLAESLTESRPPGTLEPAATPQASSAASPRPAASSLVSLAQRRRGREQGAPEAHQS
jgi:hypothetical protein